MAKIHLQKVYLENNQITIDFNAKHRLIEDLQQQLQVAQHEVGFCL